MEITTKKTFMGKKGEVSIFEIVMITLAIGSLIVGALLYSSYESLNNKVSPTTICKQQCDIRNMSFQSYNPGGYSQPTCLCKSQEGLIQTIYTGYIS